MLCSTELCLNLFNNFIIWYHYHEHTTTKADINNDLSVMRQSACFIG